ncbi:phosphohydrolase [candidate division BRC1 bacterium HGW-BRC1-1]|jgi:poly(A) polymerase|nr:MAG: phosphohydrolase [candidate division BRC1 bacterium HGW-BRC1-1]
MIGQVELQELGANDALKVIERLKAAGHEGLLVGGCVRDILLNRKPEDFDVATSALPDQVIRLFPRTIDIGQAFGVILVLPDNPKDTSPPIEVATFREESGYSDHRHPDRIVFSNARADALRRDFTMNGMFLDTATFKLLDFVNGESDLRAGLLRAIGDPKERFAEDALRILRAARFAAGFDMEIVSETRVAAAEAATTLAHISAERIRDELIKGLTRPHPDRFLRLMHELGILDVILPEVAALAGCTQPAQFHPEGDVMVHTELVLANLPPDPPPALALAALLHDIGKPPTRTVSDRIRFNDHHRVGGDMAEVICRRLAIPNTVRQDVVAMVHRHMSFMHLQRMKQSTYTRFLAAQTIDMEIALHRADCLASHGDTANCDLALGRIEELKQQGNGTVLAPPLITGKDLKALGLPTGPAYRKVLREVHDAQLDGRVLNRESALEMAQNLFSEFTRNSDSSF